MAGNCSIAARLKLFSTWNATATGIARPAVGRVGSLRRQRVREALFGEYGRSTMTGNYEALYKTTTHRPGLGIVGTGPAARRSDGAATVSAATSCGRQARPQEGETSREGATPFGANSCPRAIRSPAGGLPIRLAHESVTRRIRRESRYLERCRGARMEAALVAPGEESLFAAEGVSGRRDHDRNP